MKKEDFYQRSNYGDQGNTFEKTKQINWVLLQKERPVMAGEMLWVRKQVWTYSVLIYSQTRL